MTKNIKETSIVFMGTSPFAAVSLRSLIAGGYNVKAVYTQPGKKVGRDQEISKSPVGLIAEEKKIPTFEPSKFTDETIAELEGIDPELIIVAAYGKILPKSVLDIPKLGCINIHGSLLPKFRGPSPIQNALLDGEKETGITLIRMNEGVDTGDIISEEKTTIGSDETFPELSERLAKIAEKLLLSTLPSWINKEIEAVPQDNSKATLCQLIEREDGKIIWSDDAEDLYNRYRAFFSWPGVYAFWEKDEKPVRLKLRKINLLKNSPQTLRHIGEVFEIGDEIGVMTGKGVIILEEVQLEGKNSVGIREFMNGYSSFLGSVLK